ncbi:phage tail protein [Vibrio sp. Isolate23]|uniref:phage tail-collar fiber domain-containing protein n=1 Tax=Vibrio sp. Isolate23 TaxID=2908533 RepID=UPI001EFDBE21|nr:phage tail protein [Vibrio sp. Isolate23]
MSNALIPVITTRGLAAVFNAQNTGLAADITHMALGDNGRTPSKNEVGLVNERMRIPIAEGERIDDHQIHLAALADEDGEFWVREIGFILSDGTMLAVWSDTDPLAYKSNEVPLLLAFDLVLAALPANSVNIIGTGANLSLAAYADKFVSNAASTIFTQARVIKNAHWNMQLSEKIRLMETGK